MLFRFITTGAFVISVILAGPALAKHKNGQPHGGGGGGNTGGGATLGDLNCNINEVAKFNVTDWVAQAPVDELPRCEGVRHCDLQWSAV